VGAVAAPTAGIGSFYFVVPTEASEIAQRDAKSLAGILVLMIDTGNALDFFTAYFIH